MTFGTRLRTVLLACLIASGAFIVDSAPTAPTTPAEPGQRTERASLPFGLGPDPVNAAYCTTPNAAFTGHVTASTSSSTATGRATQPRVFGYISNIDDDWSCTLYRRYSALTWNTSATKGTYYWGNYINSTASSCNWVIGTDDYLKANNTSDCPATDAAYAMAIDLAPEGVYQNSTAHDTVGDFSFAHADCDTTPYYGHLVVKTDVGFSPTATGNRPGANCDQISIDGTGTSQTVTYDGTAPSIAFDVPSAGGPALASTTAYAVQIDATDAVAGFGGSSGWTLRRQVASSSGSSCGTFANDVAAGSLITGTANALDQTSNQTLVDGKCYRWILSATDQNGNAATALTSGQIRVDTVPRDATNLGRQQQHTFESWDLGGGDELAVNVATGNLVVTHPVVELPVRGGSVPIDLSYNGQDSTDAGLGPGWRLSLQRMLVLNADGSVTYVAADGARHTFTSPVTSGLLTTYTRPAALYATLTRDTSQADEFTLTHKDHSSDAFTLAGSLALLAKSRDRFGNGYDLAYEGASTRIDALTENGAGRVVDFTWDTSGHLDSITDWAWIDAAGIVQASAAGSRRVHRFFHDASGRLIGWAGPLNTSGTCPTGGPHVTCLTYPSGKLELSKTQTITTLTGSPAVLGTSARTITTEAVLSGSRVASVRDAEQKALGGPSTTFTWETATRLRVVRPGTPAATTSYGLVAASDPYARVQSVWRRYTEADPDVDVEQRTTWSTAFPTEPASVTDNFGALLSTPARTVSYTYVAGSLGNVQRMVEPLTGSTNRWTEHTYNANDDVTQTIVSQDGSSSLRTVTRFCYSADCSLSGSGLKLLKRIDRYVSGGASDEDTNVSIDFQHDAYGQLIREIRHNRSAGGAVLDDRVDAFTYDGSGNLVSEIVNRADGAVTAGGSDIEPGATTLARTDLTTVHAYDTAGNRRSTASPRRAILAVTGTPAVDDYVTRWTYDAENLQRSERTPTTPGVSASQKTAGGTYDELGLPRTATDLGGVVTATTYDRAGRPTATYEAAPATAAVLTGSSTYDASGRVTVAKDREQVKSGSTKGHTAYGYDSFARTLSETQATGSSPGVASTTLWAYDGLDRTSSLIVGAGAAASLETSYGYDLGGRQTETDDGFACRQATYDYRDLPLYVSEGLTGVTCASDAETVELTQAHDGLGRSTLVEISGPSGRTDIGDRTQDDVLDSVGNARSRATRESSTTTTITFVVNVLDEVTSENLADGSTAKSRYDADGNETERCFWRSGVAVGACQPVATSPWPDPPTRVNGTTYDALGQRVSLRDGTSNATTTYDPDHNYLIEAFYLPTGSGREQQSLHTYDERHRLISLTHQLCTISSGHACSAVSALGSTTLSYDDNDNITRDQGSNGAATTDRRYCYDARHQLIYRNTSALCSATAYDESMTYDAAGNRLSYDDRTFSYDSKGRLTACANGGCGTITYDSAGRISQHGTWYYHYDAEGRLVKLCEDDGCASTADKVWFTYDGEGQRTRIKTRSAIGVVVTRDLRYQSGATVEEHVTDAAHPSGALVRSYAVDESGTIVKVIVPGGEPAAGTYLVTWNAHGDAQALRRLNADGTLTLANSYTYSTWGSPTTNTHNGVTDLGFRFLYAGQYGVEWDDWSGINLHYMQTRHYKHAFGRFLQPDPSDQEQNLYTYVANSPVSAVDPSGLAMSYVGLCRCRAGSGGGGGRGPGRHPGNRPGQHETQQPQRPRQPTYYPRNWSPFRLRCSSPWRRAFCIGGTVFAVFGLYAYRNYEYRVRIQRYYPPLRYPRYR